MQPAYFGLNVTSVRASVSLLRNNSTPHQEELAATNRKRWTWWPSVQLNAAYLGSVIRLKLFHSVKRNKESDDDFRWCSIGLTGEWMQTRVWEDASSTGTVYSEQILFIKHDRLQSEAEITSLQAIISICWSRLSALVQVIMRPHCVTLLHWWAMLINISVTSKCWCALGSRWKNSWDKKTLHYSWRYILWCRSGVLTIDCI